ncbi:hypothetical protein [Lancefieldella parvula]|uniref:hypothetical protein n=1 Tax=Lancefieldella parvula TaxID=1382 RepID=UPI002889EC46|nr:hypothetical protein [Lancefieldella parvula]
MLSLQRIDGRNVWDILKLKVSKEQQSYVAGNDVSLIEAYISKTENGQIFPFGIYKDDVPVGFLMIGFGTDSSWDDAPAIAQNNYDLRRLMIDIKYQGRDTVKKRSTLRWSLYTLFLVEKQSIVGFLMSLKIKLLGISIVRLDLLRRARRTAKN